MSEAAVQVVNQNQIVPVTVIDLTNNRNARVCKNCGQMFIPTGRRQYYCTKKCYRHEHYVRDRVSNSRPKKVQDTSKEAMLECRLAGYSNSKIAKVLNCSYNTVLLKIGREPEEFKKNRLTRQHIAVVASHVERSENNKDFVEYVNTTQTGNIYRCKSCGRAIYSLEARENPTCRVCSTNRVINIRRPYGRRMM